MRVPNGPYLKFASTVKNSYFARYVPSNVIIRVLMRRNETDLPNLKIKTFSAGTCPYTMNALLLSVLVLLPRDTDFHRSRLGSLPALAFVRTAKGFCNLTPVTEIPLFQFFPTRHDRRRRVLLSSSRCPYLCLYPLTSSTTATPPIVLLGGERQLCHQLHMQTPL